MTKIALLLACIALAHASARAADDPIAAAKSAVEAANAAIKASFLVADFSPGTEKLIAAAEGALAAVSAGQGDWDSVKSDYVRKRNAYRGLQATVAKEDHELIKKNLRELWAAYTDAPGYEQIYADAYAKGADPGRGRVVLRFANLTSLTKGLSGIEADQKKGLVQAAGNKLNTFYGEKDRSEPGAEGPIQNQPVPDQKALSTEKGPLGKDPRGKVNGRLKVLEPEKTVRQEDWRERFLTAGSAAGSAVLNLLGLDDRGEPIDVQEVRSDGSTSHFVVTRDKKGRTTSAFRQDLNARGEQQALWEYDYRSNEALLTNFAPGEGLQKEAIRIDLKTGGVIRQYQVLADGQVLAPFESGLDGYRVYRDAAEADRKDPPRPLGLRLDLSHLAETPGASREAAEIIIFEWSRGGAKHQDKTLALTNWLYDTAAQSQALTLSMAFAGGVASHNKGVAPTQFQLTRTDAHGKRWVEEAVFDAASPWRDASGQPTYPIVLAVSAPREGQDGAPGGLDVSREYTLDGRLGEHRRYYCTKNSRTPVPHLVLGPEMHSPASGDQCWKDKPRLLGENDYSPVVYLVERKKKADGAWKAAEPGNAREWQFLARIEGKKVLGPFGEAAQGLSKVPVLSHGIKGAAWLGGSAFNGLVAGNQLGFAAGNAEYELAALASTYRTPAYRSLKGEQFFSDQLSANEGLRDVLDLQVRKERRETMHGQGKTPELLGSSRYAQVVGAAAGAPVTNEERLSMLAGAYSATHAMEHGLAQGGVSGAVLTTLGAANQAGLSSAESLPFIGVMAGTTKALGAASSRGVLLAESTKGLGWQGTAGRSMVQTSAIAKGSLHLWTQANYLTGTGANLEAFNQAASEGDGAGVLSFLVQAAVDGASSLASAPKVRKGPTPLQVKAWAETLDQRFKGQLDDASAQMLQLFPEAEFGQQSSRAKEAGGSIESKLNEFHANAVAKDKPGISDLDSAAKGVPDGLGTRITLDDPSPEGIQKVVDRLVAGIESGELKVTELSNYRGKNDPRPYLSDAQVEHVRGAAQRSGVAVTIKSGSGAEKGSGYTSMQMYVEYRNGGVGEFQIRGQQVDKLAEIEHLAYDVLRKNKPLSAKAAENPALVKAEGLLKGLTKEQQAAYDEYISQAYADARASEIRASEIDGQKRPAGKLPDGLPAELAIDALAPHMKHAPNPKRLTPADPAERLSDDAGPWGRRVLKDLPVTAKKALGDDYSRMDPAEQAVFKKLLEKGWSPCD